MNKQNDAHATAEASTNAPARVGAIRRFFNAWRRREKLMNYGPYDYTLDRIRLPFNTALIIGVGPDISASLARRLSALPVGDGCIEVERRIPFGIYRHLSSLSGIIWR